MDEISQFISKITDNQSEIVIYLNEAIMSLPGIEPKIKFGIPFYYRKSWICYLNPIKDHSVELAFTRGNELSNEQGILRFNGRKQICGITFSNLHDIDENAVREMLQEAILLDETTPYRLPGKRTKNK